MAGVFKTFLSNDSTATRTLLNEAVALTGSVISSSSDANVKTYSHGMFISVFDSDFTGSSANHWMDMTVGYHTSSTWLDDDDVQFTKKQIVYGQLANILMGQDSTGSINLFDQDGDLAAGGTKYTEVIAIPFSRVLNKDEIKRGSFGFRLGVGTFASPFSSIITIADDATNYRVNSPAGEYGILSASGPGVCGLLFYQAGVAVIDLATFGAMQFNAAADTFADMATSSIADICEAFRHRIYNVSFNNTLELNSTIYFCRLDHNDFNYSSNPTYLSGSRIRVKNTTNDLPATYITSVGLYGSDNSLLAVGKLSTPIKKDPSSAAIVRSRLDF